MKSVYLSPSTQEKNKGYGSYGTEEDVMNRVADIMQKLLEEKGVTVFRNQPQWTISQVVEHSNLVNPTVHVALHSNANDGVSRGCEVFCHKFGGEGEKLSRLIYEKLMQITPSGDRGIKQGKSFYGQNKHIYELSKTNAPATLVEIAFHDNPADSVWILDNIELIAKTIFSAVIEYLCVGVVSVDLAQENETLKKKIEEYEKWNNILEKEQKRLEFIIRKLRKKTP